MNTVMVFIALCVACAFWNVAASLMIYDNLQKRGRPVSFLWLRVLAPKYASEYKDITRAETGKIGPLFYHWIISINLALVFAIIATIAGL